MKKATTQGKSHGRRKANGTKKKRNMAVFLTTGYEVDVAEANGLEHLFNAVLGETLTRAKDAEGTQGTVWGAIFEVCIRELYYAAGQLRQIGNRQMTCHYLEEQFGAYWDRTRERLESEPSKKRRVKILDARPADGEREP